MKGTQVGQASSARYGILAAALLAVEFIAGIQTYLIRTVVPIVGAELDAHEFYGVINGTGQVAMFLTMPLGPYLLQRFRVDRLLLHLTWLSIAGGVISAVAGNVGVFVLGRAVAGLASGALAAVSLAAIVSVMPETWRRMVLAGYNVMWVCTSLLGPLYAGWIASALSWRWAFVLYLPLLVIARIVIARRLTGTMQSGKGGERLTLGSALLLAASVALLSFVGLRGLPDAAAITVGGAGVAGALVAAARLLPGGTLRVRAGRPAALATMGLLTAAYFGAAAIIAIIVHDLLHGTNGQVALVLGAGGLGWAFAGLAAARWPAKPARAYVRRSALGAGLLTAGLVAIGAPLLAGEMAWRVELALAGWTVAGIGMGLTYLDTLNHIVDVPQESDGVSTNKAAASAILVEAIATAVMTTVTTATVGRGVAQGGGTTITVAVLALAAVAAVSVAAAATRVRSPR
ncbi:MFS transporter [Nonomuraea sp. N2-4H]|uniref:MFS transporter n=1 Tax=Nonomuraea sp. N2-4H TaxID=3128898 RepID=UPI003251BFE7